MRLSLRLLGFCCGFAGPAWAAAPPEAVVTVEAGAQDRAHCVVSFAVPEVFKQATTLVGPDGTAVPFQIDGLGRVWYVEPALAAGQRKVYRLKAGQAPDAAAAGKVQAVREDTRVRFDSEGLPPFYYQAQPGPMPRPGIKDLFHRGGYIHPVRTPSGRLVTDDYPANHLHHHGVWFSWTKTEYKGRKPDFWNMGQGDGTVEFAGLDRAWSGPVHGGVKARHQYRELQSPGREIVLNEAWVVRVFRPLGPKPLFSAFDVVSTQTCADKDALALPTYHYGGMGLRGHWDWNGAGNTVWLTSEGETNPVKGNATRGRWCYMGGKVDGQPAGMVILCHPGNFRAPQPMRLHPTEPFFCFAPQQLGAMEITPGKPYVSQYRFLAMDGPPDKSLIERAYADYASPPAVRLDVK